MSNELYVPAQTTPAHAIRATASIAAVVRLTGLLGLRPAVEGRPPCEATADGGAIWRLTHGIVITLSFAGPDAHWSLDIDDVEA